MMKRNVLTLVIPALLAAGATNAAEVYNNDGDKLDLYGKVGGVYHFSDKNGYAGINDSTFVKLGFKGETKINDQLTGYGKWEYHIQANHSENGKDSQFNNKTSLGFVGLKLGDFSSLDYGRNYGVVYDAMSWTDTLPEFSGGSAYADNFFVGRSNSLVTYRNTDFFGIVEGWNFAVQYQGKNKDGVKGDNRGIRQANGHGYAFSTTYESPVGLGLAVAYGSGDRTDGQQNNFFAKGSKRAEQWATSVKYDDSNIYLAAMYGETHNATFIKDESNISSPYDKVGFANKTHQFELVAQYQFDFGLRPSVAYVNSKARDVESIGSVDLIKYVEVGATYFFNKKMSTYIDYLFNQISKHNELGVRHSNTVSLGLVYKF